MHRNWKSRIRSFKSSIYYDRVLISPYPDILPDVVGPNRYFRWKDGSVHVPNCKSFLVTVSERKHVKLRSRFQQHLDASCHQEFFFPARQGAERNSRHSGRNIRITCTIVWCRKKIGDFLNLCWASSRTTQNIDHHLDY